MYDLFLSPWVFLFSSGSFCLLFCLLLSSSFSCFLLLRPSLVFFFLVCLLHLSSSNGIMWCRLTWAITGSLARSLRPWLLGMTWATSISATTGWQASYQTASRQTGSSFSSQGSTPKTILLLQDNATKTLPKGNSENLENQVMVIENRIWQSKGS